MIRESLALLAIVAFVACSKETITTTTSSSETIAAPATSATETTATAATATSPTDAVGTGACALVTLGEVSEVLGHAMKFKEEASNPNECVLVSASDDPTKSVSFQVHPGPQTYDAMQSGQQQEPIQGVGEKAVIGGTTNIVLAVKGGRTYVGGVYDSAAPASVKEKSIELAKKAVPRM